MIKEILDELSSEGGSNKKMEILGKYSDNELLTRVLYQAVSKRVKFYIKELPTQVPTELRFDLEDALVVCDKLSKKELRGGDAKKAIANMLSGLSESDGDVFRRILTKKIGIGMGRTNINKVIGKDFLEKTPYMGAQSYSPEKLDKLLARAKKLNQPLFSNVKMDGRYSNALVRSGDVETESRQGEPTLFTGAKFKDECSKFDGLVFNGEILLDPKRFNRYESNGIIASIVDIQGKEEERTPEETAKKLEKLEAKHNITFQEVLDSIQYVVWDVITVDEYFAKKSTRPYNERFDQVLELTKGLHNVIPVEYELVYTKAEVMEHFQKMLNRNEEGTVLKAFDGEWKDGKPTWQLKFKLEITIDLKIISYNYGTGKNADVISSFNCESEDGLLKVSPTGLKEKEMIDITNRQDELRYSIIECKASGLSQDSAGNYSLMHPVFKKLRIGDKDTANTLEEIKEIEDMAKGLI